MDPRHVPECPRLSAWDWRGQLKPWAREITKEVTLIWCGPEPSPARHDVIVFDSPDEMHAALPTIWNRV